METERADLLYGAREIAAFLGMREKQARHRIEQEVIPTFKIGGTVCARRKTISAWLANCEKESTNGKRR